MEDILFALQLAIDSKNWYGALFITLTIPDICSKLESPTINTNKRYPDWFDKFKDVLYKGHLTGRDCYSLRCSYLHEGIQVTEKHSSKENVDKFSFSPQGPHLISMENIHVGSSEDGKTICHLSVKSFSEDMIRFARKWLKAVESNETIQKRISEMIKIKEINEPYGGVFRIG